MKGYGKKPYREQGMDIVKKWLCTLFQMDLNEAYDIVRRDDLRNKRSLHVEDIHFGSHHRKYDLECREDDFTLYILRQLEITSLMLRDIEPRVKALKNIIRYAHATIREYLHLCQPISALNTIPHFLYSYHERLGLT